MATGFRKTIGANLSEVGAVNAAVAEFVAANALPVGVRRSVQVVLDELLANTVSYGLAGRADASVTVDVSLLADRLVLVLSDNGVAFDPFARTAPDVSLSVEEREIGGLGIHLVRKLMDASTYRRAGDRNVVELVKYLNGVPSDGQHGGGAMEISTRKVGEVTIVAVSGSMDSVSSPVAQQALDAQLAGGVSKLALDFTALDYISSAGLRVLLGLAKRLGGAGGGLRIFGLNASVREVFEISGFSGILKVYGSEGEGLAGF